MPTRIISIFYFMILSLVMNIAHAAPPPSCRLSINDTLLPDFHCTASADECYQQAVQVIQSQAVQQNKVLAGCPVSPHETYLSEFDFTNRRSEYSFVFLPGLYSTAAQWWAFKNTFGANNGMRVVLPGQGASAWQGGTLVANDWIVATRRAINLAGYLGQKVILVGQSTGGFMAVWAAAQPDIKISGVAVFEPAMKVQNYYGAELCLVPAFDLAKIPHGRFFEENVNLGCVIREMSEEGTPKIMAPDVLKRMSKIPFYVFINPDDLIVNPSTTLSLALALRKAGGDVTIESYNTNYEGRHLHAACVLLPLRPRYAERLGTMTAFDQTIRGRNSYAEFIARKFNICDSQTNASYLKNFLSGYSVLYPQQASDNGVNAAIAELRSVQGSASLSSTTRATMQTYRTLYAMSLAERAGWSFPTDGQHMIMHETDWKELSTLCCTTFAKTNRFYTSSFVGPTYAPLQDQRAQVSADLAQAISGKIDSVTAARLANYLTGQEQSLLSPLVSNDFMSMDQWASGQGKCAAWQDIPAMDVSVDDIKSEIHNFLLATPTIIKTPDDEQ